MGFALGRTRVGHSVDGSKCSAADIFADTVGGLEDTSMAFEIQMLIGKASVSNDGERELA